VLEASRSQKAVDIAQRLTLLVRFCGEDSPAFRNRFGYWKKVFPEPTIKTSVKPLFKLCALLAGREQLNSLAESRRNIERWYTAPPGEWIPPSFLPSGAEDSHFG
jgi:hypothetical protein